MKKLALISDVHGNYKALEAFLKYLESHPVDGILCLGDYVTDSPYPERLMELFYAMLEQYPCWCLRGNRENYLLDNPGNCKGWKPSSANGVLQYTLQHMTERDMAFFAELPEERILDLEDYPALFLCHGTPGQVRGNVLLEEGLREQVLEDLPCRYLLGGHSHHQEKFEWQGKTYLNPGSLGIAIDGVGRRAQFAILTILSNKETPQGACAAEFLSIEYDTDAFLRDFSESGLDEIGMTLNRAVKKSLLTGVNYIYRCIVAMEEEAVKAGAPSIAELPEECWRQVGERLSL